MPANVSAFGVTHELSKSFASALGRLRPGKAAAKASQVKLNFKPIEPTGPMTGPGSMRGRMDPTAHETRMAAKRRSE